MPDLLRGMGCSVGRLLPAAPAWGLRYSTSSLPISPLHLVHPILKTEITIKLIEWRFGPMKLLLGFLFFGLGPSFLLEGGPDHMREEGVSRRRGNKSVWYRLAKNFTCMWGLESFPTTLVHQGKGKGQDGLTRTRRDQAAAWRDGGELEL